MKLKNKIMFFGLIAFSFLAGFILSSNEGDIDKEVIKYAEKIIGLEFTDAERDSMIVDLNEQLASYKNIHKISLSNSVPSSILFNPLPVGFKISGEQEEIHFSDYSYVKMPANKDELAFFSVGELAGLIRTKKISSIELTKYFLERLKKYGPILQSVITLTEERALREAKKAD